MRLGTPFEIALLGELYGIHQPPNTGDGSAFDTLQNVQAWQRICEASRKEFELIYQRLGVTIQERGESFYNPFLAPLVEELMASGIAEESEGAKASLTSAFGRCPHLFNTFTAFRLQVSHHIVMLAVRCTDVRLQLDG